MDFDNKIVKIKSQFNQFAAIDINGDLYIWQGDENPIKQNIEGKCKDIAIGKNHKVCIDDQSQIWVQGKNNKGQLGVGDYIDRQEFHKQNIINGNIVKIFCGKNCVFALGKNVILKTQVRKSLLKTEYKYINEMDELIEELKQNKKDLTDNNVKLKVYQDEIDNLRLKIKKQSEIIVTQEKQNSDLRKENKRLEKLNKELLQFKDKFDVDNMSELVVENGKMKQQIQELEQKINLQFQNNSILKNLHSQNIISLMKDSALSPSHGFTSQTGMNEEQIKNENFLKKTIIELENTLQQERKKSNNLEKELNSLKGQFEREIESELNELDLLNASLVKQVKQKDQEIVQLNQIIEMNKLQIRLQNVEPNHVSFNQNFQQNQYQHQLAPLNLQTLNYKIDSKRSSELQSPAKNQFLGNNKSVSIKQNTTGSKANQIQYENYKNQEEIQASDKKPQQDAILVTSIQGLLSEIQSLKQTKNNSEPMQDQDKQLKQNNQQENKEIILSLQVRLEEKNQEINRLKEQNEKYKEEILEQKTQIIRFKEKILYLQTKISVIEQKKEQFRLQVQQSQIKEQSYKQKNQQSLRDVNLFETGYSTQMGQSIEKEAATLFDTNKKSIGSPDSSSRFYVPELTPQQKNIVEKIKIMHQNQNNNQQQNLNHQSSYQLNQHQQLKSMINSHRGSLSNVKQQSLGNFNSYLLNPPQSSNKSNINNNNLNFNQDDQYQIQKKRSSNVANIDLEYNQDTSEIIKLDKYRIDPSSLTSPSQKKHNFQTFLSNINQSSGNHNLYQNFNNSGFQFISEFNSPKGNIRPNSYQAVQQFNDSLPKKPENRVSEDQSQSHFLGGDDTSRILPQKKLSSYLIQQQYTPIQQITTTTNTSPSYKIYVNPYQTQTETEASDETIKIQNKLENNIDSLKKLMSGLKVKTDQVLKEVLNEI